MFEAAIAGALAGYAIAIPVGAIAVLIIHVGLSRGLPAGLSAGAGAATADGIYAALAIVGGLALAGLVEPWLGPLRVLAGLVLVGFAVYGLLGLRSARDTAGRAGLLAAGHSHGRTYVSLLGLTLLNPLTVVYFAALAVGVPFLAGLAERAVFAGTAFVASLSWQSMLAVFGAVLGRGAGARLRKPTVVLGNLLVGGLGLVILLDGLAAL